MLGPHVVGQRVVVRRLVRGERGPTGGPAMTDLLGTCLSWADGECVVQPESGPAVSIRLADIVSGKPVPPRPSSRLRASTREAEGHVAALWPTVDVVPLGEWQLRIDDDTVGRRRKRANSCLAVGDPGIRTGEALAQVRTFYSERGRAPLAQLEAFSALEAEVRTEGWREIGYGESEFVLASVSRLRRTLPPALPEATLEVVQGGATAFLDTGGELTARGRAAVDGDWLGLHDIQVPPEARRRGLATAVVAALLEWGAEQGAMTAWLHVETDNVSGRAFWEARGFTRHHTCRYYAPAS